MVRMKPIFFWLFACCTVNVFHARQQKQLPTDNRQTSRFFDTSFLKRTHDVRAQLKQEGFQEGRITTADNVSLQYLYLSRPHAQYTMIFCHGFVSNKESLAPFYKLAPSDCNILLFDARGNGESSGSIYKQSLRYGKDEWKDIVAMIAFAAEKENGIPIILHGICGGAFHGINAVHKLYEEGELEKYNVKGVVFDSGFESLLSFMNTAPKGVLKLVKWFRNKRIPALMVPTYYFVSYEGKSLVDMVHNIITPFYSRLDNETRLDTKIACLPLPILFIHAHNDELVPFNEIKELAEKAQNKICWWIESSKHACHHFKFREEYHNRLHDFLNAAGVVQ